MAVKRSQAKVETRGSRRVAPTPSRWPWIGALAGLLLATFIAYTPSLHGPFLFDDFYLPMYALNEDAHLGAWTGVRPLLMLSYWANFRSAALEPDLYHLVNVFLHLANGLLVLAIFRRLLRHAGTPSSDGPALLAAGVFLLHPVQTESVAYIAGRSETLSVFFIYSAFAVYLYRRQERISWKAAAAVLVLFGAAMASKEHAVVLLALLLLTDYFFNPGFSFRGIRNNWRLYAPVAAGAVAGSYFVLTKVLFLAESAGFGVKEFTWYQYLFTQFRAFFHYLRLFLVPVGLTVDYDYPISRTLLEHGAVAGLIALLALGYLAWRYRKEYPLASYGFFAVLILLAPTSSFVPIKDPIADRRMYLPMIGYLAIVLEGLRRVRMKRASVLAMFAGVLLAYAIGTHYRSRTYSSAIAFWEDAVEKAPAKARPHHQLAFAYYAAGRCDEAVARYAEASRMEPPGYDLLLNWGIAEDCRGQTEAALEKLREAGAKNPTALVYANIGLIRAKQARWEEALSALAAAEEKDPAFAMTYVFRGNIFLATQRPTEAISQYQRALALDPSNQAARAGLIRAGRLAPANR